MRFERKSSNSGDFPIGIIRGRGHEEFLCILCATGEILQDFEAHIEAPRHVSAIEQFRLLFGFDEAEINYKTCNASIDWTGLRKHVNWHKIASSNETSVSGAAATTKNAEEAVACDPKLSVVARVRKNPTVSSLAESLRNCTFPASVSPNNIPEICPPDDCIIVLGKFDFCCKICRILFGDHTSIQTHLKGEKHFAASQKSKVVKPRGLHYDCLNCKCSIPSLARVPFHVFGSQHKKTSPASNSLWKSYSRQLGRNYVARIDQADYYCMICDATILTPDNLDQHLATKRHSDSLAKYGCQEFIAPRHRSDEFVCNCCDCAIPDFESLCIHIASRRHSKNVVVKRSDIEKLLKERDERWRKKNDQEKEAARKQTEKKEGASSLLISALSKAAGIPQAENLNNVDVDVDLILRMRDKLQVLVKFAGLCATEIGPDGASEYRCMVCKKKIGGESILVEHFHSLEHYEAYKSVREMGLNYELVGETNSDNDLVEEFLEEESEDAIHCYACDMEIDNLDESIECHIGKKSHVEKRDWMRQKNRLLFMADLAPNLGCDWYDIDKYFCALCDVNFETEFEFVQHEKSLEHEIVAKNADCLFRPLTHDFCSDCSILWYGDCVEHVRHAKTSRHNEFQSRKEKSSKVSESFSDNDFITSMLKFLRLPNQWLDGNRSMILEDFKDVVASSFPNAKIIITETIRTLCGKGCNIFLSFGSSTGESVRFSDNRIDSFARAITVALGSHFQTKTISAAYKMSRVTLKKWEQVAINGNAPRSNITALHVSSQYVVNIRLCNEIKIDRSEFFGFLASVSENFREMERTITTLQAQALRPEHEIQNISITELIIFFLQHKSWFPPISDFIEFSGVTVDFKPGWHTMITKSDGRVTWHYKTMKVMIEFHRFWANFDFHHEVVCPWIGKTMKKQDFRNLKVSRTKTNLTSEKSRDWDNDEFSTPLSVQSEFGLMENKTKKVSKAELIAFRRYCAFVVDSFEKNLKGNPGLSITKTAEHS